MDSITVQTSYNQDFYQHLNDVEELSESDSDCLSLELEQEVMKEIQAMQSDCNIIGEHLFHNPIADDQFCTYHNSVSLTAQQMRFSRSTFPFPSSPSRPSPPSPPTTAMESMAGGRDELSELLGLTVDYITDEAVSPYQQPDAGVMGYTSDVNPVFGSQEPSDLPVCVTAQVDHHSFIADKSIPAADDDRFACRSEEKTNFKKKYDSSSTTDVSRDSSVSSCSRAALHGRGGGRMPRRHRGKVLYHDGARRGASTAIAGAAARHKARRPKHARVRTVSGGRDHDASTDTSDCDDTNEPDWLPGRYSPRKKTNATRGGARPGRPRRGRPPKCKKLTEYVSKNEQEPEKDEETIMGDDSPLADRLITLVSDETVSDTAISDTDAHALDSVDTIIADVAKELHASRSVNGRTAINDLALNPTDVFEEFTCEGALISTAGEVEVTNDCPAVSAMPTLAAPSKSLPRIFDKAVRRKVKPAESLNPSAPSQKIFSVAMPARTHLSSETRRGSLHILPSVSVRLKKVQATDSSAVSLARLSRTNKTFTYTNFSLPPTSNISALPTSTISILPLTSISSSSPFISTIASTRSTSTNCSSSLPAFSSKPSISTIKSLSSVIISNPSPPQNTTVRSNDVDTSDDTSGCNLVSISPTVSSSAQHVDLSSQSGSLGANLYSPNFAAVSPASSFHFPTPSSSDCSPLYTPFSATLQDSDSGVPHDNSCAASPSAAYSAVTQQNAAPYDTPMSMSPCYTPTSASNSSDFTVSKSNTETTHVGTLTSSIQQMDWNAKSYASAQTTNGFTSSSACNSRSYPVGSMMLAIMDEKGNLIPVPNTCIPVETMQSAVPNDVANALMNNKFPTDLGCDFSNGSNGATNATPMPEVQSSAFESFKPNTPFSQQSNRGTDTGNSRDIQIKSSTVCVESPKLTNNIVPLSNNSRTVTALSHKNSTRPCNDTVHAAAKSVAISATVSEANISSAATIHSSSSFNITQTFTKRTNVKVRTNTNAAIKLSFPAVASSASNSNSVAGGNVSRPVRLQSTVSSHESTAVSNMQYPMCAESTAGNSQVTSVTESTEVGDVLAGDDLDHNYCMSPVKTLPTAVGDTEALESSSVEKTDVVEPLLNIWIKTEIDKALSNVEITEGRIKAVCDKVPNYLLSDNVKDEPKDFTDPFGENDIIDKDPVMASKKKIKLSDYLKRKPSSNVICKQEVEEIDIKEEVVSEPAPVDSVLSFSAAPRVDSMLSKQALGFVPNKETPKSLNFQKIIPRTGNNENAITVTKIISKNQIASTTIKMPRLVCVSNIAQKNLAVAAKPGKQPVVIQKLSLHNKCDVTRKTVNTNLKVAEKPTSGKHASLDLEEGELVDSPKNKANLHNMEDCEIILEKYVTKLKNSGDQNGILEAGTNADKKQFKKSRSVSKVTNSMLSASDRLTMKSLFTSAASDSNKITAVQNRKRGRDSRSSCYSSSSPDEDNDKGSTVTAGTKRRRRSSLSRSSSPRSSRRSRTTRGSSDGSRSNNGRHHRRRRSSSSSSSFSSLASSEFPSPSRRKGKSCKSHRRRRHRSSPSSSSVSSGSRRRRSRYARSRSSDGLRSSHRQSGGDGRRRHRRHRRSYSPVDDGTHYDASHQQLPYATYSGGSHVYERNGPHYPPPPRYGYSAYQYERAAAAPRDADFNRRHHDILPYTKPYTWRSKQMEERLVVYVGRVPETTTKTTLRERFSKFGNITDISLHFRDKADNYGFITFTNSDEATRAIEDGNKGEEQKFDICFGGRRQFCRQQYKDLDAAPPSSDREVPNAPSDFDTLLKQMLYRR